jgi:hypothetical protein
LRCASGKEESCGKEGGDADHSTSIAPHLGTKTFKMR